MPNYGLVSPLYWDNALSSSKSDKIFLWIGLIRCGSRHKYLKSSNSPKTAAENCLNGYSPRHHIQNGRRCPANRAVFSAALPPPPKYFFVLCPLYFTPLLGMGGNDHKSNCSGPGGGVQAGGHLCRAGRG